MIGLRSNGDFTKYLTIKVQIAHNFTMTVWGTQAEPSPDQDRAGGNGMCPRLYYPRSLSRQYMPGGKHVRDEVKFELDSSEFHPRKLSHGDLTQLFETLSGVGNNKEEREGRSNA